MNRPTTDLDNVIAPGVTRPPMNLVDEVKFKRLGISITEPWGDIISSYRAIGQILDREDASDVDNNAGASVGDTSGTGDSGSTGGADNNTDGKNAHAKAGFNTYNFTGVNTNADVGDMTSMGYAGGTDSVDNNTDDKNAYAKASFSTYNVAGTNTDAGAGAGDISDTGEEVNNNTNNTGEGQSGRVGGADKDGLGGIDKGEVGETDIETKVGVDGAEKSGTDGVNIEANKKAGARAVISTDNSIDGGGKVTDQHICLAGLTFPALAPADYADYSNLTIPKEIPLSAPTFTSDDFIATFAALANTTL